LALLSLAALEPKTEGIGVTVARVDGHDTLRARFAMFRSILSSSRSRRWYSVMVAALGVLTAGSTAAQQSPANSAAADSVRATELARREALLAADTVALSRMIGEEFVEISRRGTVRTREENLREIASRELALTTVSYDSLRVRIYGDVAVLMGIADNAGTYRGFAFSGKIRYTRVFVRRAGRWQAVAMQQTPVS
jgi:ketosteroid isomerase-like protein